jgi:hypothetical protein
MPSAKLDDYLIHMSDQFNDTKLNWRAVRFLIWRLCQAMDKRFNSSKSHTASTLPSAKQDISWAVNH